MGGKSTKTKNIVTKFTLDGVEEDLKAAGGGGRSNRPQQPPSGIPNPREAERLKHFLSVPPAVYIDDVEDDSMSIETTTTPLALDGRGQKINFVFGVIQEGIEVQH